MKSLSVDVYALAAFRISALEVDRELGWLWKTKKQHAMSSKHSSEVFVDVACFARL